VSSPKYGRKELIMANLWDKTKDVAGKVADKTGDAAKATAGATAKVAGKVADATVDGAKAAGSKTADVAKAVADKTADAAKATAQAIKKD
jgi:hypothetical protein